MSLESTATSRPECRSRFALRLTPLLLAAFGERRIAVAGKSSFPVVEKAGQDSSCSGPSIRELLVHPSPPPSSSAFGLAEPSNRMKRSPVLRWSQQLLDLRRIVLGRITRSTN